MCVGAALTPVYAAADSDVLEVRTILELRTI
jgi:hypothetical protein